MSVDEDKRKHIFSFVAEAIKLRRESISRSPPETFPSPTVNDRSAEEPAKTKGEQERESHTTTSSATKATATSSLANERKEAASISEWRGRAGAESRVTAFQESSAPGQEAQSGPVPVIRSPKPKEKTNLPGQYLHKNIHSQCHHSTFVTSPI